jgi:hypothetical protein
MPISRRSFRTLLVLSLSAFGLLAMPAIAQIPKGDLYAGFSRIGNDTFYPNAGHLNGWEASGHLNLHSPFLGAEADLARYGLGASSAVPRTTTFLFGPRITVGALGIRLFVHGLVGGEHSANPGGSISGGAFAYALGGGMDIPLVPRFAWRIQADRISAPSIVPPGGTEARFSTGLVFRL